MDRFFFGGFAFGDLLGDGDGAAAAADTVLASSSSHHRNFGASIGGRSLMPRGRRPAAACSPLLLAANPLMENAAAMDATSSRSGGANPRAIRHEFGVWG